MKSDHIPSQSPYKTKNHTLKAIPVLPSPITKKIQTKLQQKQIVLILDIVIIANTIMMRNLELLKIKIYISPIIHI
jgi:hypothetical protein